MAGLDPAIHAEAPQRLVPHWRGPQQEPANAKVFGLWQLTCGRSTRRTAWVAGSSPAMTLNPSGTSPMLPNLSSPTANAISADKFVRSNRSHAPVSPSSRSDGGSRTSCRRRVWCRQRRAFYRFIKYPAIMPGPGLFPPRCEVTSVLILRNVFLLIILYVSRASSSPVFPSSSIVKFEPFTLSLAERIRPLGSSGPT